MKISKEKLESLIRDKKEAIRKYEPLARQGEYFIPSTLRSAGISRFWKE